MEAGNFVLTIPQRAADFSTPNIIHHEFHKSSGAGYSKTFLRRTIHLEQILFKYSA